MSTTQPIRSKQLLHDFKEYYLTKQPNFRNYTIILIGLNTALRIALPIFALPLLHPSSDHRKENRKRDPNPDQQGTSENTTVLPDNTVFRNRHRLPFSQSQKNSFPSLQVSGLPHCPQSRGAGWDR